LGFRFVGKEMEIVEIVVSYISPSMTPLTPELVGTKEPHPYPNNPGYT
jgi:hypothetical protein